MCPPSPPLATRWVVVPCLLLALGFAVPGVFASGRKKRDPSIAIRLHAQVYAFDPEFTAKVKVGTPPREITIEKLASVSERDIERSISLLLEVEKWILTPARLCCCESPRRSA